MDLITKDQINSIIARTNNTYINFDGSWGNQCWDSVAYICALLGWPVVNTVDDGSSWAGFAGTMVRSFPTSAEVGDFYEVIDPSAKAEPLDICVWGAVPGLYPLTHVATAVADAGNNVLTLSQNSSAARPDLPGYSSDTTGPIILQHLPKTGLLGYIRKKGSIVLSGTILEGDTDMAVNTQMELQTAVQTVLMSNKIVKGPRSVAEGISQLLDSTDTIGARGTETLKALAVLQADVTKLTAAVAAARATQYIKGADKPEVYALDVTDGSLRHVQAEEFRVVQAVSLYRTVEQPLLDALLKKGQ